MLASLRSAHVLLVAAFLIMAATGALLTIVAVRLSASAPPFVVGLVSAGYFAGLTSGSLFAFRVILRIGHIRAFTTFATLISATVLAYPLHESAAAWMLWRFLDGFCMAGLYICMESWLNDRATPRSRGQLLAFYMIAIYCGQAAGQGLIVLPDETGFAIFIAISLLYSAAVLPVAMTRMVPPPLPDVVSLGFAQLWRTSPLGVAGTITSGMVLGALFALGPVFAGASGLSLSQTSLFMGVAIMGGVAMQWPAGRLSDRIERSRVILGVVAAIIVTSLAVAFAGPLGFGAALAAVALFGGASFALYPLCVALTNDRLPSSDRIGASGGLVLAYSAGATLGPLLASGIIARGGAEGLFAFTAAAAALVLIFGLTRRSESVHVPVSEQAPWQVQAQTTPASVPLDSLAEEEVPVLMTVETAEAQANG